MKDCSYPSCMMGGQGCDKESECDKGDDKPRKKIRDSDIKTKDGYEPEENW